MRGSRQNKIKNRRGMMQECQGLQYANRTFSFFKRKNKQLNNIYKKGRQRIDRIDKERESRFNR